MLIVQCGCNTVSGLYAVCIYHILTCGDIPLVEGAVVRTGGELEVVQGPGDAGDLALVPLQHVQGLEGDGVVHVDGVLHTGHVARSAKLKTEHLDTLIAATRRWPPWLNKLILRINIIKYPLLDTPLYLSAPALPHRELVEEPHVVNEDVEEPDLVREPGGNVETRRVDGHAEDVLSKPLKCRWFKTTSLDNRRHLGELYALGPVVPHADGVVPAAGDQQRLAVAHVQTLDGVAVEGVEQDREHAPLLRTLLLLHGEGVEKQIRGERHEEILLGADCERFD